METTTKPKERSRIRVFEKGKQSLLSFAVHERPEGSEEPEERERERERERKAAARTRVKCPDKIGLKRYVEAKQK